MLLTRPTSDAPDTPREWVNRTVRRHLEIENGAAAGVVTEIFPSPDRLSRPRPLPGVE
jgi:hypothetical protein